MLLGFRRVALIERVLQDRFHVCTVHSVQDIEEVLPVNLSSLWKVVRYTQLHLWVVLVPCVKGLNFDLLEIRNLDLRNLVTFEKLLLLGEHRTEKVLVDVVVRREIELD